jgi:hypothetical protein
MWNFDIAIYNYRCFARDTAWHAKLAERGIQTAV